MRRILLCITTLIVVGACTQEVNREPELGGISGVVADKTTGDPVSVVNVKLKEKGASTVTGTDGSFSFKDLTDGTYTVLISKEGYKENSSTVVVSSGRTTESHMLIERIPAILTLDRDVLDFGENYSNTTLSFSMVNKNYVDLDWEIVHNCRWIKEIDPSKSITKLGFGKTQTVVVVIDRDLLQNGNNETVIVIRTSDGASELTVKAIGQAKRLPALNMAVTTDLTASSAILHAEITDKGLPEYNERGFVLGDSDMPTMESAIQVIPAAVTEENAFSARITNLQLGKTYYARAYAKNEVGIVLSTNEDVFTVPASLPSVNTLECTDVKASSVILNAEVTDIGIPDYTERGFVMGLAEMPTKETAILVAPASVTAENTYSVRISDLTLGQKYYVRAYITNALGTAYSANQSSFTTIAILPTVETLSAQSEDTETKTVVLRGSVSYEGDPAYTERGFVWSTEYDIPTIEEEKVVISGSGTGDYERRVAFPSISKTIYVRAYATNARGTAYGETIQVFQPDYVVLSELKLGVQRSDINDSPVFWNDANSLCRNSVIGGLNDWRLPTKDELFQLYNKKDEIGGFSTEGDSYSSISQGDWYWSSTQNDSGLYWYVCFSNGISSTTLPNVHALMARCVRTLE